MNSTEIRQNSFTTGEGKSDIDTEIQESILTKIVVVMVVLECIY